MLRPRSFSIAASLTLTCAAAGCAANRTHEDAAKLRDPAFVPTDMIDGAAAVLHAEARMSSVWPGFWSPGEPVLFYRRADEVLLLMADEAPDPSFSAVRDGRVPEALRGRLFARHGMLPGLESAFHTSFRVGTVVAVAVAWDPEEEENDVLNTLFHEAFHEYQEAHFDDNSTDYFVAPSLIAAPEFRALAEVERRMLAHALDLSPNSLPEHLRRYLAVRAVRLSSLPDSVASRERQIERIEGSAAYVGYLATRPADPAVEEMAALLREAYLTVALDDYPGGLPEQLIRWRVYGTGSSLAFLLDRMGVVGWREALEAGAGFDELLADAVAFDFAAAAPLAESALADFGFAQLLAEAAPRVEADVTMTAAAFHRLGAASITLELPVSLTDGKPDMELFFSGGSRGFQQLEGELVYMPEVASFTLQLPYAALVIEDMPVLFDTGAMSGLTLRISVSLSERPAIPGLSASGESVELDRIELRAEGMHIRIDRPVVVSRRSDGVVSIEARRQDL